MASEGSTPSAGSRQPDGQQSLCVPTTHRFRSPSAFLLSPSRVYPDGHPAVHTGAIPDQQQLSGKRSRWLHLGRARLLSGRHAISTPRIRLALTRFGKWVSALVLPISHMRPVLGQGGGMNNYKFSRSALSGANAKKRGLSPIIPRCRGKAAATREDFF